MKFFIAILFVFSSNVFSEEITEQSFIGKWCGKWDNTFQTCISIDDVKDGSIAKYQWLEHPNGKFKKADKKIERVNRNTLKIENIWFALDENDLSVANAMGVFRVQSRIVIFKKIED